MGHDLPGIHSLRGNDDRSVQRRFQLNSYILDSLEVLKGVKVSKELINSDILTRSLNINELWPFLINFAK